eukprot:gene14083-14202_t
MRPLAIGIDLGGTQVRAALINENGIILKRTAVRTAATSGPEAVLTQIDTVAKAVAAGVETTRIIGVGVSAPGPLDAKAGIALNIPTLAGFVNYPLAAALRARLEMPVVLENDGIAAASGEWHFGAGRGFENMVYVTVSTGIGGGVVVDNHILHGRRGMAGHVGHMSIERNGELCSCGNRGCFEAYGSGPAFTARAQKRALACAGTILGAEGSSIDGPAVFAAARDGDFLGLELVAEEAAILGRGFTNLLHVFSPDILVVGGGLSNEFNALYPGIHSAIQKCAMPAFRDVLIVRAELGDNSGLVGAAGLVFAKIINA